MKYWVYIIKSKLDGSYYKGFSEDPYKRLLQHNIGESTYTSGKIPWELVFLQSFTLKRDALIREKILKKYSHAQIEILLESRLNELVG
ncbi:MAG: GIY-YIG nuclease family protein [Ferruginibacter sp.]